MKSFSKLVFSAFSLVIAAYGFYGGNVFCQSAAYILILTEIVFHSFCIVILLFSNEIRYEVRRQSSSYGPFIKLTVTIMSLAEYFIFITHGHVGLGVSAFLIYTTIIGLIIFEDKYDEKTLHN